MHVTSDSGTHTICGTAYAVQVSDGQPYATLTDPDGQQWSRLCLLAALDRVGVRDESYAVQPVRVSEQPDHVELRLAAASTAWADKTVRMRCYDDRVELVVTVRGAGTLTDVHLLGGRAVLASGASGIFGSSIGFASVFDPTPTEPVQVVRPATSAVTLGIVGDASPGRLNGIFSPPPLCLAFGRALPESPTALPAGAWLSAELLAPVTQLRCTQLRYLAVDGGFRIELDYDGHTEVDGEFSTPPLVLRRAAGPVPALQRHRADLIARGFAEPGPQQPGAGWWREPLFCGWGAQCARARSTADPAAELCRQELYDEWLAILARHGVVPGTVVIDDRWQASYGTAVPDTAHWPDLREWIARRHAAGQRVLLWWKAWDPGGLPDAECVLDPAGRPVSADPGSPAYLERLARIVTGLVAPGGLDADGFKVDFTQRAPAGTGLRRPGAPEGAPWGIAALHALLRALYLAAKAAKPDALVITHTPHPGFADVTDMIRLNDVLERDPRGAAVPPADQLAFRHAVAHASMPNHLIDTDQWPMPDLQAWRDYVRAQPALGVPALYYAERIDGSGEQLAGADLALVADSWRAYRRDTVV